MKSFAALFHSGIKLKDSWQATSTGRQVEPLSQVHFSAVFSRTRLGLALDLSSVTSPPPPSSRQSRQLLLHTASL